MTRAVSPSYFSYENITDITLPGRDPEGNKGTFGKVLVVAGSRETGGAAILASRAALRSGCGMVRVFTEKTNRDVLLQALPEALTDVYDADAFPGHGGLELLDRATDWADAVVCGCGIGTSDTARVVLEHLLDGQKKPLVLDADALNLLSMPGNGLLEKACAYASEAEERPLVFTPHAAEFARLYSRAFDTTVTVKACKQHAGEYPAALAQKTGAIVLFKDARSVVTNGTEPYYLNKSGNDGMATAGSGDVLAGLLGALLAERRGKDAFETVCRAVYCHGLAGDLAAEKTGRRALIASDLAQALTEILRRIDERGDQDGFVAKCIK